MHYNAPFFTAPVTFALHPLHAQPHPCFTTTIDAAAPVLKHNDKYLYFQICNNTMLSCFFFFFLKYFALPLFTGKTDLHF